jgi:hypothetical protein
MALPLLPLLLLGGAAVVVLASSKSSSSSGSKSSKKELPPPPKVSKVAEAYTDDSAYLCLALNLDASDTQDSLNKEADPVVSEYRAKASALESQGKLQNFTWITAFTLKPFDASILCSSLSKSVAGVPGTNALVMVANLSNVSGGEAEACSAVNIVLSNMGVGEVTYQECGVLYSPDYAGMGFALNASISDPGSINLQRFIVRTDGTIEWSQPQVQPSVPPQQTQPTQPIQPSVPSEPKPGDYVPILPPFPPEGVPLALAGYDEVNNVLGVEITAPYDPGSAIDSQVSNYYNSAVEFVRSRSSFPTTVVKGVILGPVEDVLEKGFLGKDAMLYYSRSTGIIPMDEQGQVMSILEEAYNTYGSTVSFLRVQEDGHQPEYFILVHSTGDLVRV